MPRNGIRFFRSRLGINRAELARRANTTRQQIGRLEDDKRKLTLHWATVLAEVLNCSASDLMFFDNARLGAAVHRNIFMASAKNADDYAISLHSDILQKLTAPASRLELFEVDTNDIHKSAAKGDFVLVDRDATGVARPGVYLIDVAGVQGWRYLSPSATGDTVLVHSDNEQMVPETVAEGRLKILGRVRAKLAAM